jgi:DNA-binding NarL/FixJ family response regulator
MVCLRNPLAEQVVANAAAQLGLSDVITTAASGSEALARVTRAPADILLVDTASVRPDTIGFTRRVLERSPEAVLVFFGPEEAEVARAAVAAGARGLIRGGEREDLVASVAKALMLLLRGGRATAGSAVPLQRSEPEPGEEGAEDGEPAQSPAPEGTATGPASSTTPTGIAPVAGNGGSAASATTPVAPAGNGSALGVNAARRLALTERELQVLRGMADGKSNAEIGRELFVSEDTVKTHARRLFRKLGARDRAHAVAAAFRAGLVR